MTAGKEDQLVEMLAKPTSTPTRRTRKGDPTTKFEVTGATASVELRGTKEEVSETGALQCLARHDEDPGQWVPTGFRAWTLYDGTEATHYTFARVGSRAAQLAQQAEATAVPLDDLLPTVRKARPKKVRTEGDHGALILIGDTQFGKIDGDGVEGTLARTIACIDNARDALSWYRKRYDIGHVHIGWLGDHIEGFVSQGGANAWRTPLTLNEQIRLTRRVMLHSLETFAQEADKVSMAAVPGNHGDPQRFMGKGVTRYDDSHDTEALIAVSEAAAMNPKAFGHVEFYVPQTDELTVVQDIAGTRVAQVHGHFWRPGKHFQWWKGQAFSQTSLMHGVDLLVAGHLHHEFVDTDGPRTFIQTPPMESESTWFRHRTGTDGAPGLMLAITKDGQVPVKEVVRA